MGGVTRIAPVVSKIYCFSSQTTLLVRQRPRIVNGGGLVVMNPDQNVVFSVDGCGILGIKGELVLRDGGGAPVLFIHKKVITFTPCYHYIVAFTELFETIREVSCKP